jgi:hypothetical protein
MSKRSDTEHPKVLLQRVVGGFKPATGYDEERCQHYGVGHTVEVTLFQNRSLPQLRLYWVVLHDVVENSEGKYGRAEDLHEILKIELGYQQRVKLLTPNKEMFDLAKGLGAEIGDIRKSLAASNADRSFIQRLDATLDAVKILGHQAEIVVLPGSIALNRMDQSEFKIFFERAMSKLRERGYEIDKFLDEGRRKLAGFRYAGLPKDRRDT